MLTPYVIADADHALSAVEYASAGTASGIGMLSTVAPNPVVDLIRDLGTFWNLAWIGALAALLWRFRPPAVRGVAIVWLALYVFGTGFYINYLVLGLPFLLMDGALLAVAFVQVLLLAPLIISYGGLFGSYLVNRAFDVPMLSLWLFFIGVLAHYAAQALRRSEPRSRDPQPALDAT
jgi:hypothetical protein